MEKYLKMQNKAYKDIFDFLQTNPNIKELVKFHTCYKYFIYARSHSSYKELGNIVANRDKLPLKIVLQEYQEAFLKSLSIKPTTKNIYNVFLHIFGYFKKDMSEDEKIKMLNMINGYKDKIIKPDQVVKALNFYTKKYNITYLKTQKFLDKRYIF